ncbi:DUF222 domain-containing protein [Nocardia sp. NPDC050406]|uniref:HNH endonuclease signature motif containing protein n=1 Tax=Nocardia sp. NPDC050406 TaxID=3364318 RepID=UPI00379B3394
MNSGGEINKKGAEAILADLDALLDSLLDTPTAIMSDDEFIDHMREFEAFARKVAVVQHRFAQAVADRGLAQRYGFSPTAGVRSFLVETLNLSRGDAAARANAAEHLDDRRFSPNGYLPPALPLTAAAQAAGEVSADHVRVIISVMDRIPASVEQQSRTEAEERLVESARVCTPDGLKKVGARILAFLDPDGKLTSDRDRARMRSLVRSTQRIDGMIEFKGLFNPEATAFLDTMLAKWARPGMCNPEDPDSPMVADPDGDDRSLVEAAAARDTRSQAQRNHDALLAYLKHGGPETLGKHRGIPVSVVLTMTVEDVEKASGCATTATGGTVPMKTALEMAEGSIPTLMVFDHTQNKPLHLAPGVRLANKWQRLARIATDRGCTRPGCSAPATMCQMHHVLGFAQGGLTHIENLTLACDQCHGRITGTAAGWETEVLDHNSDHPGRVGWRAPAHVDPTGLLEVNHVHHPDEVLYQADVRIEARRQHESRSDTARSAAPEPPW